MSIRNLKNTEKIDSNTQTTINHWDLDLTKNQPEPYHYGGKQNQGKVLTVSADGFIRLANGGGGGGTHNPTFTGTMNAENIVVSGDLTCKSGTATTDIDFSNAKTLIVPHITLVEPATATSGTITELQLATLQSTDNAYILFNNEKYYLADKEHTTGSLGYTHCGYENNKRVYKNITITISTKGWVLNKDNLYQHTLFLVSDTTHKCVFTTFNIYTNSATPIDTTTIETTLNTYFPSSTPKIILQCGVKQANTTPDYFYTLISSNSSDTTNGTLYFTYFNNTQTEQTVEVNSNEWDSVIDTVTQLR